VIILNRIETILHPIRFRIIQTFLDGQQKTAKMLTKELKDIPQATLYRQLETLVKADILKISAEHPVRGTVEKVYTLNSSKAVLQNSEIKNLTKEEHLQYFLLFNAQLAKDFEEYLQKENWDFEKDGVGYRQIVLHLSDEEFNSFINEMSTIVKKYVKNSPAPNRTKRLFSSIVMPKYDGGMKNE
jgi:DNA-binding HxlR family transcriptional regulator